MGGKGCCSEYPKDSPRPRLLCGCANLYPLFPLHSDRIFAVMGHPGAGGWADLEALRHWRDNTENVRLRRPDHGSRSLKQLLWEESPLLR